MIKIYQNRIFVESKDITDYFVSFTLNMTGGNTHFQLEGELFGITQNAESVNNGKRGVYILYRDGTFDIVIPQTAIRLKDKLNHISIVPDHFNAQNGISKILVGAQFQLVDRNPSMSDAEIMRMHDQVYSENIQFSGIEAVQEPVLIEQPVTPRPMEINQLSEAITEIMGANGIPESLNPPARLSTAQEMNRIQESISMNFGEPIARRSELFGQAISAEMRAEILVRRLQKSQSVPPLSGKEKENVDRLVEDRKIELLVIQMEKKIERDIKEIPDPFELDDSLEN
jgi:hypothetical protein